MQFWIRFLILLLILLPGTEIGAPAYAADWDPRFELPAISGDVYAVSEFQGELLVAGFFSSIGHKDFNSIARWDDGAWSPLGISPADGVTNESQWEQHPGIVHELLAWNGLLVAAGAFDHAGGNPIVVKLWQLPNFICLISV